MARRQDERTGRQALTGDTKSAVMMDMCPVELGRHLVLNSARYDEGSRRGRVRGRTHGQTNSRPKSAHIGRVRETHIHEHALLRMVPMAFHKSIKAYTPPTHEEVSRRGTHRGDGLLLQHGEKHTNALPQVFPNTDNSCSCADQQRGYARLVRLVAKDMLNLGRMTTSQP